MAQEGDALAVGFDNVASEYDRSRPTYSAKIFDNFPKSFKNDCKRIVEVGAGTGLFTSLLLNYFPTTTTIVATEPLKNMRSILSFKFSNHSNVEVHDGLADNLSMIDTNSVDAIFCAQSFHWFSNINSLKEFQRILSPKNSYLIMVWNREDWKNNIFLKGLFENILYLNSNQCPRTNYQKKYDEMENKLLIKRNLMKHGLGSFEEFKFIWMYNTHQMETNCNGLIDLILSWSGLASSSNQCRKKYKKMIEETVINHFGSLDARIRLPYDTYLIFSKCNKRGRLNTIISFMFYFLCLCVIIYLFPY